MHSFHFIWTQKETPFLLVGAGGAGEVISVLRHRGIVVTLRGAETSKRGHDTASIFAVAVLVAFLIRADDTLSLRCKAENFGVSASASIGGTTISGPVVVTVAGVFGSIGGTTRSGPVPVGFAVGLNELHARDGARGVVPVADGTREGEVAVSKHILVEKGVDRRSGGRGVGGGGGLIIAWLYALLALLWARRQLFLVYGILCPLVAFLVLPLVVTPTLEWAEASDWAANTNKVHHFLEEASVVVGEVGGVIVDLLLGKATPGEEGGDVVGGGVGVGGRGGGDEGQGYEGNVAEEHGYSMEIYMV